MRLVRDLGERHVASVEDDLEATIKFLEGSIETQGVPYNDGEGNYCVVGAAAAATFESETALLGDSVLKALPTYSFREDCLVQELYFAIPRWYREAKVESQRRTLVNGVRSRVQDHRRSICIAYNDEHRKDEVVAWAKQALYRVRESERHRA